MACIGERDHTDVLCVYYCEYEHGGGYIAGGWSAFALCEFWRHFHRHTDVRFWYFDGHQH